MSARQVENKRLLRVIDANFNRAQEALRVVEDCGRFILDHAGLANCAKSMRHRLRIAAQSVGMKTISLLQARDTERDVGTEIAAKGGQERRSLADVLRANFQRLAQSLRVLEEYSKLLGRGAEHFEKLRYDSYTLEKDFASPPAKSGSLLDKPLLVLIGTEMTADGRPQSVVELARRILKGGCRLLELREKEMPDAGFLALARELLKLTREHDALLVVNDRVDAARASGADGVHLGLDDLPIEEARRILGPSKLVGMTVHSIAELKDACERGADYAGVGTMFSSPTKPDLVVKGPACLVPAAAKLDIPCYFIGGITRANIDRLLSLGATRVAVGSAITRSNNPAAQTRWFVRKLESVAKASHHQGQDQSP